MVWVPAPYTHIFFTYICFKNCTDVCLRKPENNRKRGRAWPISKNCVGQLYIATTACTTNWQSVISSFYPLQHGETWKGTWVVKLSFTPRCASAKIRYDDDDNDDDDDDDNDNDNDDDNNDDDDDVDDGQCNRNFYFFRRTKGGRSSFFFLLRHCFRLVQLFWSKSSLKQLLICFVMNSVTSKKSPNV